MTKAVTYHFHSFVELRKTMEHVNVVGVVTQYYDPNQDDRHEIYDKLIKLIVEKTMENLERPAPPEAIVQVRSFSKVETE